MAPAHNFIEAVKECRAAYQLMKADGKCDPYKISVLNLLSSAEPGALAVPDSNLEDFLWGQLWFVLAAGTIRARIYMRLILPRFYRGARGFCI